MNQELLQLIDTKLVISLQEVDDKISDQIRNEWNVFSPAPNCPTAGSVQEKIKNICHAEFLERQKTAAEQLEKLLSQHGSILNKRLTNDLMFVLEKHFPDDKYVTLASKTEDVYLRKCSPRNRLASKVVELNQSLIQIGAKNMSRKSRHILAQIIKDYELRAKKEKKHPLKKVLYFLANYVVIPSVKWVLAIISAVLVAVATYYLTGSS